MTHRMADTQPPTSMRLPLPPLADMSDQQVRGAHCTYCRTPVSSATAIDLGERRIRFLDGGVSMFPRACQPCARDVGEAAQSCALCSQPIDASHTVEQRHLVTDSGPDFATYVHTDPCPADEDGADL